MTSLPTRIAALREAVEATRTCGCSCDDRWHTAMMLAHTQHLGPLLEAVEEMEEALRRVDLHTTHAPFLPDSTIQKVRDVLEKWCVR